jgi:hypothetical protein
VKKGATTKKIKQHGVKREGFLFREPLSCLRVCNNIYHGKANHNPAFYDEFKRRTAKGRHYNPNTDPQAWEKSTADLIAFMDKAGLPH